MTITDEQLAELERLAMDATPGPWVATPWNRGLDEKAAVHALRPDHGLDYFVASMEVSYPDGTEEQATSHAAHIAACDPPTILALVDEVRQLRVELESGLAASVASLGEALDRSEAIAERIRNDNEQYESELDRVMSRCDELEQQLADEREACAKLAEDNGQQLNERIEEFDPVNDTQRAMVKRWEDSVVKAWEIANAIRARGEEARDGE